MTCPSPPPLLPARALPSGVRTAHPSEYLSQVPLPETPTLSEVFSASALDGSGPAFVMAALTGGATLTDGALTGDTDTGRRAAVSARPARSAAGPVLWIQDRTSLKETGRPYLAGTAPGAVPDMLHLTVGRAADVLWAMEQGLGCPTLSGVVGEIWGTPSALDFTATKRLVLRAEAHGVPAWLIRRAGAPDLSAARMRWTLAAAPSERLDDDPRAPGLPRWTARLFRARGLRPGSWTVRYDPARHAMVFSAAPTGDAMREAIPPSGATVVPLQASA